MGVAFNLDGVRIRDRLPHRERNKRINRSRQKKSIMRTVDDRSLLIGCGNKEVESNTIKRGRIKRG
jgi:hypothetical protein